MNLTDEDIAKILALKPDDASLVYLVMKCVVDRQNTADPDPASFQNSVERITTGIVASLTPNKQIARKLLEIVADKIDVAGTLGEAIIKREEFKKAVEKDKEEDWT